MVHAAAVAGLDPEVAWDRTPGELVEYIRAYRDRQQETAYLLYDLAGAIANACLGKRRLQMSMMSDQQIYANCLAWCAALSGMEEDAHGSGKAQ